MALLDSVRTDAPVETPGFLFLRLPLILVMAVCTAHAYHFKLWY